MVNRAKLRGRKEVLDHDLTYRERKIQRELEGIAGWEQR